MGCFSWMFANKDNLDALRMGRKGYVLTPQNQLLSTPVGGYEGYGDFYDSIKGTTVDVYDLVVDWNRAYLSKIINHPLKKTETTDFDKMLAVLAEKGDAVAEEFVKSEVAAGRASEYLLSDWKRCLGIAIACYDEDNERLPYPIKIVSCKNCGNYEDLPASKRDKKQGF